MPGLHDMRISIIRPGTYVRALVVRPHHPTLIVDGIVEDVDVHVASTGDVWTYYGLDKHRKGLGPFPACHVYLTLHAAEEEAARRNAERKRNLSRRGELPS